MNVTARLYWFKGYRKESGAWRLRRIAGQNHNGPMLRSYPLSRNTGVIVFDFTELEEFFYLLIRNFVHPFRGNKIQEFVSCKT